MFRDRLNHKSFSTEVKQTEDGKKRQTELMNRFSSTNTANNVNFCLRNITLKVEVGSNVCIVGDDSSGKHELFLAIM